MARVHTLKAMAEEVLRNEPETRNSDILLTHRIWERFYPAKIKVGASGEKGVWLKDMYDLPREDNVKRVRAMLNAEGKYFPTDWKIAAEGKYFPTDWKIAKGRGIEQDEWRKALGYPTKDETVKPTQADAYMDPERDYSKPKLAL